MKKLFAKLGPVHYFGLLIALVALIWVITLLRKPEPKKPDTYQPAPPPEKIRIKPTKRQLSADSNLLMLDSIYTPERHE